MSLPVDLARRRAGSATSPANVSGRVLPHNLQAEESLLGAMLLSRDALSQSVEVGCKAEDFYKPAHARIYEAIHSLTNKGEPADPVTVADELARADLLDAIGGPSTLVALQANTPATSNAGRYAGIVQEHALLRRLIRAAGEIAEMGYSMPEDIVATVDQAEALIFQVANHKEGDTLAPLNKLLSDAFDRLEALVHRGESITGVPTGFVDLDEQLSGLQPSNLVIVGARPAMGKCVAWDTPIVDPTTGDLRTAAEVYRLGIAAEMVDVLTLDHEHQLRTVQPSAFVDDGKKPVFRVRSMLGREIRTTLSHPFLTPDGWTPLGRLQPGDRVGVPNEVPAFGVEAMPDDEVALLAYLLAGAREAVEVPELRSCNYSVVQEAARCASRLGARGLRREHNDGSTSAVFLARAGCVNPVIELLRRHGLVTVSSPGRDIPAAVYRLARSQLAAFLSRLLAVDGQVAVDLDGSGSGSVEWATCSRRLAFSVQHLLLRFGVSATLKNDQKNPHLQLLVISEATDIRRFVRQVGLYGKEMELDGLVRSLPMAVKQKVLVGAGAIAGDISTPTLWEDAAVFLGHDIVPQNAEFPGDAHVRWDEIVSIDYEGEEQVYDLTIPIHHNFIAADFIVHNTSFALNIVSHAAVEAHVPVLFFSLEMSHSEITQRLLCSEARVDATRFRNGRLHDSDWPKIHHALGRLGEAPVYIDESARVTVMDIRAKARRLKAAPGGLGLVVIDYLQLMSGRQNAENRQVEVSEMSRGLKILARELKVPVVALSQLSRNLEMRADKRPALADLRESGSLEQDADVVMFLYRDEVYNPESPDRGTAEVIVAKHRNGPVGTTQLAFIDRYTRFANMART